MKSVRITFVFAFLTISCAVNEKIVENQFTYDQINADINKISIKNSAESKDESPVTPIGTFMRVKTDGEHASGYLVRLWKQDDKIYGLISAHRGLMGDPPTGLLENVRFNKKPKKFSFKAKLSLGLFLSKDSAYAPSRDVFEFNGTLTKTNLAGNLLITNELCPDKCPETKKINLLRSKEWSVGMSSYKNYAEWKVFADEILSFRGPQW